MLVCAETNRGLADPDPVSQVDHLLALLLLLLLQQLQQQQQKWHKH